MRKSIRLKLIVYILSPVIFLYLVVSADNLWHIKRVTIENTQLKLVEESFLASNKLENELRAIEQLAFRMQADLSTYKELDDEKVYAYLEESIKSNFLLNGATLSFDSFEFDKNRKLFSPYVFKINDSIRKVDIADSYNYLLKVHQWFNKSKNQKTPSWSEPYKGEVAGKMFSSYTFPIFKNEKLWAVLVFDISLVDIIEKIKLKSLDDCNYFIVTKGERFIYSPNINDIGKKIWESDYFKSSDRKVKDNVKSIISENVIGQSDYHYSINHTDYWVNYSQVKNSDWKVAISISKYTALKEYRREIIQAIAFLLLIALVLIIIILRIARKISKPIKELTVISEKITSGDKHITFEVKSKDEIGRLANSFRAMTTKLLKRKAELKKANLNLDLANKELQGFDFARNNFLKIISHEIRTPLNGIIGMVDLLEQDIGKESEFCEFMQMLKQSVDRLESFSTTALIITELQTESFNLDTKEFKIDYLLSKSVECLSPKIEAKNLRIVKKQYNDLLKSKLNEYYIEYALTSVLCNAIKYSPLNSEIQLKLYENDGEIRLDIIDQGEGFNERSLHSLFEPFGMGEDHYDQNTGLSLKAAKSIMVVHGGDIYVENLNAGGACVRFVFKN